MLLETYILSSDQSLDQIRRQLVESHPYAVVLTSGEGAEHHPVGRYHLRGELVYRIFKVIDGGDIAHPSLGE